MSLNDKVKWIDRTRRTDDRGWFLKVLTGTENFLPRYVGEVYLTMALPGEWRANHYHPKTGEWFTVFKGEAKIIVEDVVTKERLCFHVTEAEQRTLFVPPGVAHVFLNTSTNEEMLLAVYAANRYDPADTIMYNLLENEI